MPVSFLSDKVETFCLLLLQRHSPCGNIVSQYGSGLWPVYLPMRACLPLAGGSKFNSKKFENDPGIR